MYFPDENLEGAIREAIGKGDIWVSDLLELSSVIVWSKNIKNIEGIQYCKNLTNLNISENQIRDIGALTELTKLTHLRISENQISDISPLAGLTKLIELRLVGDNVIYGDGDIKDISAVTGLTNLTKLYLGYNQINDISTSAKVLHHNLYSVP
ncbi:MAG: leucine-rich repeat domain-containing protein [Desulfobacteraceae bacterium]|nr:leucine-rich repeat domain-containing protein [Desulfobacteraceae bacterium]